MAVYIALFLSLLCLSARLASTRTFCADPESYAQLVEVEEGDKVTLQCRHCPRDGQIMVAGEEVATPRIWWQRRLGSAPVEVQFEVAAPIVAQRIYVTPDHRLVIQRFLPQVDGDIFECDAFKRRDLPPVKYFLDELKVARVKEKLVSGNWSEFRTFEETSLRKAEAALQDLAGDEKAASVLMHWGPWSPCKACSLGRGRWWRRGRCRISTSGSHPFLPSNLTVISCRSSLLDSLSLSPELGATLANLPDFVLTDACECLQKGASQVLETAKVEKAFERSLAGGDSLQILCPREEQSSEWELVEWSRGLELLPPGKWVSVGKRCRLRVDLTGSLLVEAAEPNVQGVYTCRTLHRHHKFLLTFRPASPLSSPECKAAFLVVGIALMVCSIMYCSYACMLCFEMRNGVERDSEREEGQEELLDLQPWRVERYADDGGYNYEADVDSDGQGADMAPLKTRLEVTLLNAN